MSNNEMKQCSKCELWKPATTEYFRKKKGCKFGLNNWCKVCETEHAKQHYQDNRDQYLERSKQWYQDNREQYLERQRQYYQDNRENRLERRRQHYQDNRDQYLEYSKQHYQDNREKHLERVKQWQQNNPDKHRIYSHKRRARMAELPYNWNNDLWQLCVDYFDCKCAYCGRDIDMFSWLEMEHFIPVEDKRPDNPGTVPTNMLPACNSKDELLSCNQSKGDKDPYEWLDRRFGKKEAQKIAARIHEYFEWIGELEVE